MVCTGGRGCPSVCLSPRGAPCAPIRRWHGWAGGDAPLLGRHWPSHARVPLSHGRDGSQPRGTAPASRSEALGTEASVRVVSDGPAWSPLIPCTLSRQGMGGPGGGHRPQQPQMPGSSHTAWGPCMPQTHLTPSTRAHAVGARWCTRGLHVELNCTRNPWCWAQGPRPARHRRRLLRQEGPLQRSPMGAPQSPLQGATGRSGFLPSPAVPLKRGAEVGEGRGTPCASESVTGNHHHHHHR